MKGLIWFGCILVPVAIQSILRMNGITLGAIPTVILFYAGLTAATRLCKKVDANREDKRRS